MNFRMREFKNRIFMDGYSQIRNFLVSVVADAGNPASVIADAGNSASVITYAGFSASVIAKTFVLACEETVFLLAFSFIFMVFICFHEIA